MKKLSSAALSLLAMLAVAAFAVDASAQDKVKSGTVELSSTSIAIGIGVQWGDGTVTLNNGTKHTFSVTGLSVVDLGISSVEATGEIYNLTDISMLSGTYKVFEGGVTAGAGGSAISMENGKGVIINLQSTQLGVKLSVAGGGMDVTLDE